MQQHQIVLKDVKHSGTVNAKKLELSAEQPGGGQLKLAITPEKITFTGKDLPAQWRHQVTTYSAPELHRYWNKLPYYELRQDISNSETEQFADEICATEVNNQWGKFPTMGRLFLLGFDQLPENRLYLCGHAPRNYSASSGAGSTLAKPKAQLLNTINHSHVQNITGFSKKTLNLLKKRIEASYGIEIGDEAFEEIFN